MKTARAEIISMGEKIKNFRIDCQMTQKQLAERSGISLRCVQRFEKGEDIQLSNLIKILNALNLAKNIEQLIPDVTRRPSAFVEKNKIRKRVRTSNTSRDTNKFKWGDEQ